MSTLAEHVQNYLRLRRALGFKLVGEGVLPRTLAAVTGRGGYHMLYGHPGGKIMSGAGKGGPGVDQAL